MTNKVGMTGHTPSVLVGPPVNPEKAKYEKMWGHDQYRKVSPGEQAVATFLQQATPVPGAEIIDFGCGTGRASLMLSLLGRMKVTMIDIAANCLDSDVVDACTTQPSRISFVEADLTGPLPVNHAQYGFCCDVMEHIPPDDVVTVLRNVMGKAQHVFFMIATVDDVMGDLIGEKLHLTVQPTSWWMEKFRELDCVIHWTQEPDGRALFYVSNWVSCKEIVDTGQVNTALEKVQDQIRTNIYRGFMQCIPAQKQETEVMLLGGGPSLADYTDEIKQCREDGMKLVTTNGAYNWAIENGMTPSAQVIVDAREFNKRFVSPVVDDCKYLLSSHCHPSVFDDLPRDRVYLWHSVLDDDTANIYSEYYDKWYPIPGGSTVMLRALCLLRTLGFYKFHVYGFDSCLRDDEHHAFAQAENDGTNPIPVSCGGKIFRCHPWMAAQAQEFKGLIQAFGDELKLDVKGDGLIAHIIATGAELEDLDDGSNSMEPVRQSKG